MCMRVHGVQRPATRAGYSAAPLGGLNLKMLGVYARFSEDEKKDSDGKMRKKEGKGRRGRTSTVD
jgi:hypothetical protein